MIESIKKIFTNMMFNAVNTLSRALIKIVDFLDKKYEDEKTDKLNNKIDEHNDKLKNKIDNGNIEDLI